MSALIETCQHEQALLCPRSSLLGIDLDGRMLMVVSFERWIALTSRRFLSVDGQYADESSCSRSKESTVH